MLFLVKILPILTLSILTAGSPLNLTENRVHNGFEPTEAYPSLVSVGSREGNSFSVFCGGTLITEQHVLTAAHCFKPSVSTFRIVLGSRNKFEGGEEIEFPPSAWTFNPRYDPDNLWNHDTAIIRLPRPVQLSRTIQTTRLARKDYSQNVRVVGWGRKDCRGTMPTYYLFAKGQVIDTRSCRRNFGLPVDVDAHLCAINFVNSFGQASGHDGGDSGGPLYATADDGKDVQIGIVSSNQVKDKGTKRECVVTSQPCVYDRISAERDFILSQAPGAQFV